MFFGDLLLWTWVAYGVVFGRNAEYGCLRRQTFCDRCRLCNRLSAFKFVMKIQIECNPGKLLNLKCFSILVCIRLNNSFYVMLWLPDTKQILSKYFILISSFATLSGFAPLKCKQRSEEGDLSAFHLRTLSPPDNCLF